MSRLPSKFTNVSSEAELVNRLVHMLLDDGYRVRTEVSNMGQSVDLVATRGRWVTVVEAKLYNWKRAVEQCRAHEQVADYVCVAVASVSVAQELLVEARRSGYGVIHFDRTSQQFVWAVRPILNRRVWRPQRRRWTHGMKAIDVCQLTTG
jgi:hypothetical protein